MLSTSAAMLRATTKSPTVKTIAVMQWIVCIAAIGATTGGSPRVPSHPPQRPRLNEVEAQPVEEVESVLEKV
jgi:hypothetical protein